ncbi:MAG: hypothetical protein KDC54_18265 [Lewinella sp.]|nr:hypothetical protein [Lewinella sp.]
MIRSQADSSATWLTLELKTVHEDDRPVYVSGTFNDWASGDERYRMTKVAPGQYTLRIDLPPSDELIAYKYLRGTWEGVEVDEHGNESPNRIVRPGQQLRRDRVPRWKQDGLFYDPAFLPKIVILSEEFEVPQLIRTRRIAALLPHDYEERTDRRYPVLYLQDGQNLFDEYAPFGNWAVDKRLAFLAEQGMGDLIVISIDHAEDKRIAEFTPSHQTRLGRGEGKKYVRFLADTLKPYVDRYFRTLPGWAHTGIGGSSMGGLISIYAGLMYPEVYGRLMIFSPSLWVMPQIPFQLLNFSEPYGGRIYLYGGQKESDTMVPNLERLKHAIEEQLRDAPVKPVFKLSVDPEGEHNEARWGEEFPRAVRWLFYH